jgi:hypothetical protein
MPNNERLNWSFYYAAMSSKASSYVSSQYTIVMPNILLDKDTLYGPQCSIHATTKTHEYVIKKALQKKKHFTRRLTMSHAKISLCKLI